MTAEIKKHIAKHQYFRCCGVFEEYKDDDGLISIVYDLYYTDQLDQAEEADYLNFRYPTELYVLPDREYRVIVAVQHDILEPDSDYFTLCLPETLLQLAMQDPSEQILRLC